MKIGDRSIHGEVFKCTDEWWWSHGLRAEREWKSCHNEGRVVLNWELVSGRVVLVILVLVFPSLAVRPPTLTLFYNSHQVTNGLCSEGSNISIFLANELFSRTGQTAVLYPIYENMTNVLQQLDPMYEEFRNTMSMTEPAILASTLIWRDYSPIKPMA